MRSLCELRSNRSFDTDTLRHCAASRAGIAHFIEQKTVKLRNGNYSESERRSAGGKYLARGVAHEVYEGDWEPRRIVLFEFPSVAAFSFCNGAVYQSLRPLRDACSSARLVSVEGWAHGVLPTPPSSGRPNRLDRSAAAHVER